MKLSISSNKHAASMLPALLGGAIALLAGCASGPESHVISAPPPAPVATTVATPTGTTTTTTTSAPVMTSNGTTSTIIVTQAPPAPQAIVIARPEQPSSSHVWLDGYWTWRNERYEWMPAHWDLPPSSGGVWVYPRYESVGGNSYRFYEGYWKY